ncbi:MAG: DUF1549 domain-containing protein, partial [Planctomycetes bacterium]|nr:DUF1549 domain-containing protein [Planctomycetota bacterium]
MMAHRKRRRRKFAHKPEGRLNRSCWQVLLATLLTALPSGTLIGEDASTLTFEKDIRPIFRAHCYDCHGATEELEGGLDLRLVRLMQQGGDSGPALEPGDAAASLLIDRVRSGEMPPGDTKVSQQELATLVRWVAAGCPTARPEPETIPPGLGITPEERAFWSFQPVDAPSLEQLNAIVPDQIADHPIDKLYLADTLEITVRDEKEVITRRDELIAKAPWLIASEASKQTLIVRAYFDLIGLPPTPEELSQWLQHPSEDWYEQLLATLLDSPHYGERWGRHWLDAAGYADSEGYTTADAPRNWAWKYRDWVVQALNQDKPFDEFISEQLAGDELAGPLQGDLTAEQIALLTATGFLRMAADGTGSGANTPEAR